MRKYAKKEVEVIPTPNGILLRSPEYKLVKINSSK